MTEYNNKLRKNCQLSIAELMRLSRVEVDNDGFERIESLNQVEPGKVEPSHVQLRIGRRSHTEILNDASIQEVDDYGFEIEEPHSSFGKTIQSSEISPIVEPQSMNCPRTTKNCSRSMPNWIIG